MTVKTQFSFVQCGFHLCHMERYTFLSTVIPPEKNVSECLQLFAVECLEILIQTFLYSLELPAQFI